MSRKLLEAPHAPRVVPSREHPGAVGAVGALAALAAHPFTPSIDLPRDPGGSL